MIYKVLVTKQAEKDIEGIFVYIALGLLSIENAHKQINRIESVINSLDQLPKRHKIYKRGNWAKLKLRMMPVDNYCVFYLVNDAKREVYVSRVMYCKRDLENM